MLATAIPVRPLAPFVAFGAFGAFWGMWGASLPRLREAAGLDDAQLGVALLFVGAGALPAMLLVGRALDRWGLRLAAPLLLSLGLAGCAVALTAHLGFAALCIGMALVGATSGATDVAMNAVAGRAEQALARPVITPAHATLSGFVVVGSLGTGVMGAAGSPFALPFAVVALATLLAAVVVLRALPAHPSAVTSTADRPPDSDSLAGRGMLSLAVLLGLGMLGALAFAGENAQQSWSAAFLEDELSVAPGVSALGPAVFAAVVAATRFSISGLPARHARAVVVCGSLVATAGAGLLAGAPTLPVALVALALAAAGTAVLFPTLLGVVSRAVPEHRRGRTTSLVTTVAYTGFLAGPPFVGLLADAAGLRAAMIAVAGLTAVLAGLAPFVLRRSGRLVLTPSR
ncbi:MFS transporter [uncultured Microbacterium sp.]|uniref:MFS transporter n=1 Tax=uncultured Microbacterium sp. TaxID=191216 RepID=UPI0028DB3DC9|nr:MFS transporter [uncultured Microbacterium sp.]